MKLLFATACFGLLAACTQDTEPGPLETTATRSSNGVANGPQLPSGPFSPRAGEEGPTFLQELRGEVFDPRLGHSPVLDPIRHRVLTLGGWTSGAVRTDTLEWDGLGWQRRISSGQPGARFAAGTVHDSFKSRILAFGGFSSTSPLSLASDATWEWNGADWAVVPTETAPPPRGGAPMAMHGKTGEIWMFGGSQQSTDASLSVSDELYRFDGRRWTKIEKPAGQPWPPPRSIASLAYDPVSETLVLFGGFGVFNADPSGYPSIGQPLYDTWAWNGTTWTQQVTAEAPTGTIYLADDGSTLPMVGRQAMLFDERANALVLVHEALAGIEIWRYDATVPSWTPTSRPARNGVGPNFRLLSSAFIDPRSKDIVVTGGLKTGVPLGTTYLELLALVADDDVDLSEYFAGEMNNEQWSFDGTRWTQRTSAADPGPRVDASAAYDESRQLGVMHGGRFGSSTTLGDTWIWSGGHWSEFTGTPRPEARRSHALAYDPVRKGVILFGGLDADGAPLDDTWFWNGAWTRLAVSGPAPRSGHQLMRIDAGVLLYGGRLANGTTPLDSWVLGASDWTFAPTPVAPGNGWGSCSASASGINPMMFGGYRGSENRGTDDQVYFDQPTRVWFPVALGAGSFELAERRFCTLFADPSRNQIMIGGGLGGGADSSWNRFDLATNVWHVVSPRPADRLMDPPRQHVGAAYFFDSKTNTPTYYGGSAPGIETITGQTWRIRQLGDSCSDGSSCANGNTCVEGVCCESSACGPCESCALPGSRGVCTSRGTIQSAPGCAAEQGLACNTDGRCRAADGATCTDDPQCASGNCIAGTCCSAEGCVQRCVDESTQRNPNGSDTNCGTYACRGSACLTTCSSPDDCSPGTVCTTERQCVAVGSGTGETPGGCSTAPGAPAAPASALAALVGLLVAARSRRRDPAP